MDFSQQIIIAVVVLGLLGALVRIARDRGLAQFSFSKGPAKPRRMEVLERLTLTPNHSLHLVTVDKLTVLVSVSPSGCQLLEKGTPEDRQ
jgi:flagellar biogenesis protein FliO